MKLAEIKGEAALDLLADIIEPAVEIATDDEVREALKNGDKAKAIAAGIRGHKKALLAIMAKIEGESAEEYAESVNILTLPKKVLEILNDEDFVRLFMLQEQTEGVKSSIPVSEKNAD